MAALDEMSAYIKAMKILLAWAENLLRRNDKLPRLDYHAHTHITGTTIYRKKEWFTRRVGGKRNTGRSESATIFFKLAADID
jgi:hypothetical protein